jgi:hypothetical protein
MDLFRYRRPGQAPVPEMLLGAGMRVAARVALAMLLVIQSSVVAAAVHWQLVGTTYNSVTFLDRSSIVRAGAIRSVTVLRISGQPRADGWSNVTQRVAVDCAGRRFLDKGSMIRNADGSTKTFPATSAHRDVPSRGVFAQLFEAVCGGRRGAMVSDPIDWTRRNFRPH